MRRILEEIRNGIKHRYFFGTVRAKRERYLGPDSLPLPIQDKEIFDVLIIRSFYGIEESLEKLNVSECDAVAYAKKNRSLMNKWGADLYTSYSLMHFWRYRGVPLFVLAKGYPADTS